MTTFREAIAEARDQALHALAAMVILCPFRHGPALALIIAAILIGLVRETAQHGTFRIWSLGWGSWLDITCWAVGGAVLGAIG